MRIIKAHCVKHNKWFKIAVEDDGRVINFENVTVDAAKGFETQVDSTSFETASNLRACMKCGSRHVGRCGHVQQWHHCDLDYFYQCLYCDQLRISLKAADSRFSEYVGQSNIVGAKLDKYGNPLGEQYDLAKRDGFKGFNIIILCCDFEFGKGKTAYQNLLSGPVVALREKGFAVTAIPPDDYRYFDSETHVKAGPLESLLGPQTQLWIISNTKNGFDETSAEVVERFYKDGGGLYLWGDNDPFHAEADFFARRLFNLGMTGNYIGEKVLGVKSMSSSGGIIPGHPISTGIAHFYEGITIAAVQTNSEVKPLVYSSDGNVVTAYSESNNSRLLFDGGFTRLYWSWDAAGTGRFVTNCAAWLANAKDDTEIPFT